VGPAHVSPYTIFFANSTLIWSVNSRSIHDQCDLRITLENIAVFCDLNIKLWFSKILAQKSWFYANNSRSTQPSNFFVYPL
jgi:hypothetical protein